jgi:ribonuclease J
VQTGVPEKSVVLAGDGVVVELVDSKASITGRVEVGRVYADAPAVSDIPGVVVAGRCQAGCRTAVPRALSIR